jgi:hypothetical protein
MGASRAVRFLGDLGRVMAGDDGGGRQTAK